MDKCPHKSGQKKYIGTGFVLLILPTTNDEMIGISISTVIIDLFYFPKVVPTQDDMVRELIPLLIIKALYPLCP